MGIIDDIFNGFLTGYLIRKLYNWIPGGVIAGAVSCLTLFIFTLILVSFPLGQVGGIEDVFCIFGLFFSPLALVLGAIGSIVVTRIVKRSHQEIPPERLTKLTGAAIGISVGIVAAIILIYILLDVSSL
jgi:hypothetical protein